MFLINYDENIVDLWVYFVSQFETRRCLINFHLFPSEIAAWLAENGPVSVALNAFAMQVSVCVTTITPSHTQTAETESLTFDTIYHITMHQIFNRI